MIYVDRRTDMAKLTGAFREYANAPNYKPKSCRYSYAMTNMESE